MYAEPVPAVGGTVDAAVSPSVAMLVAAAKSNSIYLVGGSIPERETGSDGSENIYNTSGAPAGVPDSTAVLSWFVSSHTTL